MCDIWIKGTAVYRGASLVSKHGSREAAEAKARLLLARQIEAGVVAEARRYEADIAARLEARKAALMARYDIRIVEMLLGRGFRVMRGGRAIARYKDRASAERAAGRLILAQIGD
ncbi:hypothetical protein AOQ71_31595 [Bradyrhizobium manausense]|uniref:Uncharacterized protein n=1 Tax=Bradyrhizobium manausense TaxID=989370 RepID=A0A0R3D0N9_9BRAD|nr:hypothetical protein AOQ71_31595 [Bradyrhizobium manausense]